VPFFVAVKEMQDEPGYQKDSFFVVWYKALLQVLVMTNEVHLGE
jgi:hypothetical protein